MDGLALLCTLHADGPATLKRLRRAGCGNLGTLLERPAGDLADVLDLSPAAARRMLREARLLAERVGPELELEESHEGLRGSADEVVLPRPAALDQRDRDLVASIRRPRAEREPAQRPASRVEPSETEAVEAERVEPVETPTHDGPELRAVELRPTPPVAAVEPTTAARVVEPVEDLDPADEVVESIDAGGSALLAVDGIDAELAADLAGLGLDSVAALAEVDALLLRRELGVTFAQAKRLTFLARRALEAAPPARESVSREPGPQASLLATPSATPSAAPKAAPEVAVAAEAAPAAETPPVAPTAGPEVAPERRPPLDLPRWSAPITPTPTVAPARAATAERPAREPAPEVAPEPAPGPAVGPADGPATAPPPRPKFWEPRAYLAAEAERTDEVQGEPVDPAEVARPRRFWESRQAARAREVAAARTPAEAPPVDAPSSSGTTLGWDWSLGPVTPPEAEVRAAEPPPTSAWEPLRRRDEDDDSSAGPFA